jgi:tetratricopeptide (TPR) repeat protein
VDKLSSAGKKLSVAMIARDAETTIAAALDSVRAIADEIIVVDTGSTDRTRHVARQRASKLLEFPWANDFSAARNFALAHLSGDWVLWLDASEQLDRDSAEAIRQQLDSRPQPRAYALFVRVPAGSGQVDGEEISQIRLWPIRAGLKFTGRVREQLVPTLAAVDLALEATTWRMARSPRNTSVAIKAEKAKRDLHLAELEIAENSARPLVFTSLGDAYATLGQAEQAAAWFRRAIEAAPRASNEQLAAYYGWLTTFDGCPQLRDEQITACVKALEVFPLDAQLLCAMGSYMQSQGRLDLAARSYQMAVEHGQINLQVWHLTNLAEHATACYSLALDLQGRTSEASQILEVAIAKHHGSERLRRHLIDLHIKHNRRREAMAEADRLPVSEAQHEALRNAVRGACLAVQQQWAAAMSYLQNAHQAGCRDPLCLRWLATGLLGTGNSSAAEAILRQWQAAAPDNPEPVRMLLNFAVPQPVANSRGKTNHPIEHLKRWIDTTSPGGAPHIGAVSPSPDSVSVNR